MGRDLARVKGARDKGPLENGTCLPTPSEMLGCEGGIALSKEKKRGRQGEKIFSA